MSLLMKHGAKAKPTSKKVANDSLNNVVQTAERISRDVDRLHNVDLLSLLSRIDGEKGIAKDRGDARALAELERIEKWATSAKIKLSQI